MGGFFYAQKGANDLNKRINILLQLIFIAAITLTIWNGVEGAKLNQRYERSVKEHELTTQKYKDSAKQYEQSTADYIQYLKHSKEQIQKHIEELRL